jgi:hypothetical protein
VTIDDRIAGVASATLLAASLLAAACTSVPGPDRPTPSPSPPPPVRISGASPFATGCARGSTPVRDSEVEPTLAADPGDPRFLVAAWQQDRNVEGAAAGLLTARSSDGGLHWQTGPSPDITTCEGGPYPLASDPWLSAGRGRMYLSFVGVRSDGPGNLLAVATSSDRGATWGGPVVVATGDASRTVDKPEVLADRSRAGFAYLVWVEYHAPGPNRPPENNVALSSHTTDGGRTWSAPVEVYGTDSETQFHTLVQTGNGTLVDLFAEGQSLTIDPRAHVPARVAAARSTDGGLTWNVPASVADFTFTTVTDRSGTVHVRATSANLTAASGRGGSVWVIWSDVLPAGTSRLIMARSSDDGLTWNPPVAAVEGEAVPFLPQLATAGDGRLGLLWYQAGPSTVEGRLDTEVWFGVSADEGATWRRQRLAGPFDLLGAKLAREGAFVGDYEALAGLPSGFAAAYVVVGDSGGTGPSDIIFARR